MDPVWLTPRLGKLDVYVFFVDWFFGSKRVYLSYRKVLHDNERINKKTTATGALVGFLAPRVDDTVSYHITSGPKFSSIVSLILSAVLSRACTQTN